MIWLKKNWLIILILAVSLFFRLYRIGDTMTFLEDEGRDVLIAKRMLDTGRPVLLGPQTSTGNMYLGPLYYYFITPSLALAQMDPVGPAIMIALSGVLATYLLFYLAGKWFGQKAGYLASIMFAVLPFSVAVTRSSWNPNLVPLISILMLIVYDLLITQKSRLLNWLFFGMLVGIMVQLHYMALIFCGVMSLSLVWTYRRDWLELGRGVGIAILGFVLMMMPFFVFELRNDWVNTNALTRFMLAKEERNIRYDLPIWLWWDKVSTTSSRLIGNTLVGSEFSKDVRTPYVVISFLIFMLLKLYSSLKSKNKIYQNLVIIFLGCLSVLGIYQENIHMHYLEFGIPLIILIISGVFVPQSSKILKSLGLIFVIFVLYVGGSRAYNYIHSGSTHQAEKAKIVTDYIVGKASGRPYNLVSSPTTSTSPYQYFAFTSSQPPSNQAQKLVYMICQNQECNPSDLQNPSMFIHGPSHPTLDNYIGHPLATYVVETKDVQSNEHVFLGIWVAEIVLE